MTATAKAQRQMAIYLLSLDWGISTTHPLWDVLRGISRAQVEEQLIKFFDDAEVRYNIDGYFWTVLDPQLWQSTFDTWVSNSGDIKAMIIEMEKEAQIAAAQEQAGWSGLESEA